MKEILLDLGLKLSLIIGGLMGGIASLTFEKSVSFGRAMVLIFSGGVSAGYLTTLIMNFTKLPDNLEHGASFIIGLTSMKLLAFIIKLVNNRTKKNGISN